MTVNVLSLLEAEGAADIFMQVVKLSEESRKLPEQVVLSVFVVIVLVDIDSLNVTATVVETATLVELSSGLTEATVGAVVSEVVVEELSVLAVLLSVSEPLPLLLSSLPLLPSLVVRPGCEQFLIMVAHCSAHCLPRRSFAARNRHCSDDRFHEQLVEAVEQDLYIPNAMPNS